MKNEEKKDNREERRYLFIFKVNSQHFWQSFNHYFQRKTSTKKEQPN